MANSFAAPHLSDRCEWPNCAYCPQGDYADKCPSSTLKGPPTMGDCVSENLIHYDIGRIMPTSILKLTTLAKAVRTLITFAFPKRVNR